MTDEKLEYFEILEETGVEGFVETIKAQKPPKKKAVTRCSFWSDLRTIVNYIQAEQQRKVSSLRIGIFTVFLVVTIITVLESVISIVPILFVKIGQQNAGAIDVKLTYQASDLISGNNNFYTRDPFAVGN